MDQKCAPGKKFSNGSCFSLEQLINISIELNKKYPNNKIKIIKDKKQLLKNLTKVMKKNYNCDDQLCWLNTDLVKKMDDDEINFFTFRPEGPEKKTEWLSTSDISNVIKQYESKYNNFKYLGTVPYDFQELPFLDVYNVDFDQLLKQNKYQIGLVINLDKHTESGSHWVGLYSNLKENQIYFFDSFAKPPGKAIKRFITKIFNFMYEKKYNSELKPEMVKSRSPKLKDFDITYNKVRHQYKSSECGVYSINFILRLLKGNENFYSISENVTKDDEMNACRDVYFNNYKK